MIAAILERHGLRTGAYLSPHLVSFTERVRVGDSDVEPERFARRGRSAPRTPPRSSIARSADDDRVTQFEALTAAAFSELAGARGRRRGDRGRPRRPLGRDQRAASTVQVLTNVGLEHTRWLGPTIADIAREKVAVVRAGRARSWSAPTCIPMRAPPPNASSPSATRRSSSAGRRRRRRALPGLPAAQLRRSRAPPPRRSSASSIPTRSSRGRRADVTVPGRFEVVARRPATCSTARTTRRAWRRWPRRCRSCLGGRRLVAVVSILEDKDAAAMLRCCCRAATHVVFTAAANPRALSPATLASLCAQVGGVRGTVAVERDAARALALARELAGAGRRRAGDRLDLPASPTCCGPPGAAPRVDAVNDDGPRCPADGRARGGRSSRS